MLKGVNRQVVEEPESDYFEKVICFVKPEYFGMGEAGIREKAAAVLKNTVRPPKNQNARASLRLAAALRLALAAALGAGAALLLQGLLR